MRSDNAFHEQKSKEQVYSGEMLLCREISEKLVPEELC